MPSSAKDRSIVRSIDLNFIRLWTCTRLRFSNLQLTTVKTLKIALQAYTGPSLSAPYDAAADDDVAKCFVHGAWLDHFIIRLLLTVRYSEIFKIDQCFKKL